MKYKPGELGDFADTELQRLRTSISDQLPEDRSDLSIHVYLFRDEHIIGNGKSVLVVNITNDQIDFKMRDSLNLYVSKDSEKSKNLIQTIVSLVKKFLECIGHALGM